MFKAGKHLTREERRRIQQTQANLIGLCGILSVLAVGVVAGLLL